MVFKKKKKVEPQINEDEIIDMPEDIEADPEVAKLKAKIKLLEKKTEDAKALAEEEPDEPEEPSEEVPEIEPAQPTQELQQPIPQTRVVYLTDSEAIRQILAELQNLRFIVEQEIAKE